MLNTHEVEQMTCVARGLNHGPSPIPQEGRWVQAREIKDISGFTHGVGWCAPQQGACKLTLNIKDGIIQEALIETLGCTRNDSIRRPWPRNSYRQNHLGGPEHRFGLDAINTAMRIVSPNCMVAASQPFRKMAWPSVLPFEDLGKGLRSTVGTMFSTLEKGPRYLELTEGYVLKMGLDQNDQIIGYQFLKLGPMLEMIKKGVDANEAYTKNIGTYGRFDDAVRVIDPRHE